MSLFGALGAMFGDPPPTEIGTPPEAVEPGSELEQVRDALRGVIDPELGINIVDLGLVYGLSIDASRVSVVMTMTSPACPLGGVIKSEARAAIRQLFPGHEVETHLVWQPPWTSDRITQAGREMLGFG